jgi:hypothetical protein
MTSLAWAGRRRFELFCRLGAIVLLGIAALTVWSHGRAGRTASRSSVFTIATPDSLRALRDLVVRNETRAQDTLVMPLRVIPSAPVRAALGTLHQSGIAGTVTWQDATGARGAAMTVELEGGPQGGVQLRLAQPDSTDLVVLRDAGGILDSIDAFGSLHGRVRQWQLASAGEGLAVRLSGAILSAPLSRTRNDTVHRVLVIASPGWESKFVMAALEERGWRVESRLAVTPKAAVMVGTSTAPDVTRHAAVVVLDSMNVPTALAAYVRRGGGVVFSGDGVRSPLARELMTVAGDTRVPAVPGALLTATPLDGLERWQFGARDAIPLLRTAGRPTVLAVRIGTGRAIVSGYRNTWQWRMMGTDQGQADHADWWDALVQAALPIAASPINAADPAPGDAAPYADQVAQLGAPQPEQGPSGELQRPHTVSASAVGWPLSIRWLPWLVGLAFGALLVEWASRRLRGEP